MRSPRYWLKKGYGELRIAKRRGQLEREVSEALGRSLTLSPFGDGGNDSIYLATCVGGEDVAVVRLFNPYKDAFLRWRKMRTCFFEKCRPANDRNDLLAWLNREWQRCQELADSGVTPRPLWRCADAMVVSYVPGTRMNQLLSSLPPDQWWGWIDLAFRALAHFHRHGGAHHDAKAANVVLDEVAMRAYFIDLDCCPNASDSLLAQRAFDYLKLISSLVQIAPRRLRENGDRWARAIDPHVPDDIRDVNTCPLLERETMRHLARCFPVRRALASTFGGIAPRKTSRKGAKAQREDKKRRQDG